MNEEAAEAESRETGGFRKRARDHQICLSANPRDHGDLRKFEIGFIDYDDSARGSIQHSLNFLL
jgi:hypothetical protein